MSTYVTRDILAFDDGEVDISSGDLAVAGVRQSQRQLIVTLLSTTRGDFLYDPLVGWGGDNYIGKTNNPITHQTMNNDLGIMFGKAEDISLEDLFYRVSWLDQDTVAVVLRHNGVFIEQDGSLNTDVLILGWKFPFSTGQIELEE